MNFMSCVSGLHGKMKEKTVLYLNIRIHW